MKNKEISELKIGDWIYSFSSHILHRQKFDGYTFCQIIGETEKYWILDNGYYNKARKSDLKKSGSVHNWEYFHMMDEETYRLKKLKEEWEKQNEK